MELLIREHKLNERSFYDTVFEKAELPGSTRAYIYGSGYEYSSMDIEEKLCNMGAAITRNVDLYSEFKKDIDYHMEDPQCGGYEYNAKLQLIKYIDFLRECGTLSLFILHDLDNVDIKILIDLLIEEIKLRYEEYGSPDNIHFTAFFHSIPIDYIPIMQRYDLKTKKGKEACIKYALTSQETISNKQKNNL